MSFVFAFDRDDAVTSSPQKQGPIPVEWVRYLAHETDHEVWATGNQKLKDEAGIPGTEELIERYRERWGEPTEHFNERTHPKVERREGLPDGAPDPDIVSTLYSREGNSPPAGFSPDASLSRDQRIRLLGALFPDHDKRVVIDNKYLGYLSGWVHFYPQELVEFVELGGSLLEVSAPAGDDVPDLYDWPRTEE